MVKLSEIFMVQIKYKYRLSASELKSSLGLKYGLGNIFVTDMGQGSCNWINVAKHRLIE